MMTQGKEFVDYVWSFYGPGQIYGDYFKNALTKTELKRAIKEHLANPPFPFDGDSVDREYVRDIMLKNREAK